MNGKGLELIETLAAISRVAKNLALKLAVMAAKAEADEEQESRAAHCDRRQEDLRRNHKAERSFK